jgi:hypothetical protein
VKRTLSHPMALVLALLCFLLLGLTLSSWATCAWFLLGMLVCVVPGWFACRLLYGLEYARRLDSLGHTLILGLLVTTFLSVVIAAVGPGLTVPVMLIAALAGALLLFLFGRWVMSPLSTFGDDRPADTRLVITIGLILVPVIISGPFLNVGREVGDSHVYAPYFNRDFLRSVAFGAQLSKGVIPPANPYFEGETLHYYWFQMVFPALVYNLSGRSVVLEELFLLSTLLVNVSFVFVFVHFLRRFVKRTPALIIVLGLAFAAESYQAPFKAILSLQPTHWALEGTWLGAIALPPVGYFFQHLLYLPHHFVALVGLLIVVSLLAEQSPHNRVKRAMVAAVILVVSGGFSFFITAFGFLWAGSYLGLQALGDGYALVRNRGSEQRESPLVATVLSGIIVGMAGLVTYALLSGLGMLLGGGNAWDLMLSQSQLLAPVHFFVMLGPMSVLGLAGFVLCARDEQNRSRFYGVFWLLLSVLFLIVFVVPKSLPTWEISQKLGVVLRIPVLVLAGVFLDHFVNRDMRRRRLAWAVLLLFCASAIPNLLAYEYIHLNVQNSDLLTYVGSAEVKAAAWIRRQTPLNAVVQAWPGGQTSVRSFYRSGEDVYSLVSVFGERQTAFGDPQFARYYLPRSRYQEVDARATEISRIYEEPERADVVGVLEKFQIDYVYWGPSERRCCVENLVWYEESSLFEEVYNQDGVSIFHFVPE